MVYQLLSMLNVSKLINVAIVLTVITFELINLQERELLSILSFIIKCLIPFQLSILIHVNDYAAVNEAYLNHVNVQQTHFKLYLIRAIAWTILDGLFAWKTAVISIKFHANVKGSSANYFIHFHLSIQYFVNGNNLKVTSGHVDIWLQKLF